MDGLVGTEVMACPEGSELSAAGRANASDRWGVEDLFPDAFPSGVDRGSKPRLSSRDCATASEVLADPRDEFQPEFDAQVERRRLHDRLGALPRQRIARRRRRVAILLGIQA